MTESVSWPNSLQLGFTLYSLGLICNKNTGTIPSFGIVYRTASCFLRGGGFHGIHPRKLPLLAGVSHQAENREGFKQFGQAGRMMTTMLLKTRNVPLETWVCHLFHFVDTPSCCFPFKNPHEFKRGTLKTRHTQILSARI